MQGFAGDGEVQGLIAGFELHDQRNAYIEEQRQQPSIEREVEEGLQAQAEYEAMLEGEQELLVVLDYREQENSQQHDALRAEEAAREAEAAYIEEQRRQPSIEREVEEGLQAQAEYEAMLEGEQEREYREQENLQEYDALRAEEAAREAEAELEMEQDFEYSIEQTIRAETEGEDAAMSEALSQHEAQSALDGVNADNDRMSARDLLASYGASLSLALLERSRNPALHEDTCEAVPALVGLLRSKTGGPSLTAQNAAAALANLTVVSPANRVAALQATAVPPLVALLRPELPGACHAAIALHNIAWRDAAAKSAVRAAGGIARLSALLEGRHAEVAAKPSPSPNHLPPALPLMRMRTLTLTRWRRSRCGRSRRAAPRTSSLCYTRAASRGSWASRGRARARARHAWRRARSASSTRSCSCATRGCGASHWTA